MSIDNWRSITFLGLALGAAVISAALISQYGFGLAPCPLCILQRWPYVAGIAAAALALLFSNRPALSAAFIGAAALAFTIGVGLGVWHSGVEWGVFPPPACEGDLSSGSGLSGGDIMNREFGLPCDARVPFFLGLSMANWNVLMSIALLGLFALAARARGMNRAVP